MNLVTNPFTGFEETTTWFVSTIISVIRVQKHRPKQKENNNHQQQQHNIGAGKGVALGTVQVAVLVHSYLSLGKTTQILQN